MSRLSRWIAILAGLGVCAATVLPPLSTMAESLFAAHMLRHLLLIALAAPLLAWGGIAPRARPAAVWIGFVAIFLFWHWPTAFRWAALHPLGWPLELGSILLAALVFWGTVLGKGPLSDGGRALMVMTAAVATDLPGVVMVFAPTAICTMPRENAGAFGLTPLADQQLAGLLMWVPANLVFFGIATLLFARWIGAGSASSTPLVLS